MNGGFDESREKKNGKDLQDRTFNFAVRTIKFLKNIRHSSENNVIKLQLVKAATSIGANYEEAQGAYSRDDFKYKISICFREAKESNYWFRIIKSAMVNEGSELELLIQESNELKQIFGTIVKKINYRET